ncbi:hypothetical protein [Arenibaculum pallidiluteum]|uniref:hypothetical protein n=1 Tax=Arenibaculum pallidiluteum TaxID=2812559 RepID=UPI001A9733F2|nr:hypothetical protein [Arenibaculum pallidiluteum]
MLRIPDCARAARVVVLAGAALLSGCKTLEPPPLTVAKPEERFQVLHSATFPEKAQTFMGRRMQDGMFQESMAAFAEGAVFEGGYLAAPPLHYFRTDEHNVESFAKIWRRFATGAYTPGRARTIATALGSKPVHCVASPREDCAIWNWLLAPVDGMQDLFGKRVTGYLCVAAPARLFDDQIERTLAGYGVRGLGLPPPPGEAGQPSASTASWCGVFRPGNKDCLRAEAEDHHECLLSMASAYSDRAYNICRNGKLSKRRGTAVPPGPIEIVRCDFSGVVINMNRITCIQHAGTGLP